MRLEDYLTLDLNNLQITTAQDYFDLLGNLGLSEDLIVESGNGYCCFGVSYCEKYKSGEFLIFEDLITFEGELTLKITVYGADSNKVKHQTKTFKLNEAKDVLLIAKKYDEADGIVEYNGELYFTLIGGGFDKPFIRLSDETVVFVEDIEG